uniref:Uncharacterized protein n=1 Tax=Pygocentrus nattereri TaxID=42514 RepID=A0A3B4E0Q5_PYGNA
MLVKTSRTAPDIYNIPRCRRNAPVGCMNMFYLPVCVRMCLSSWLGLAKLKVALMFTLRCVARLKALLHTRHTWQRSLPCMVLQWRRRAFAVEGLARSLRSNSSQRCSVGLKSGLCAGQSSSSTPISLIHVFMDLLCALVHSHIGTGRGRPQTVPTKSGA